MEIPDPAPEIVVTLPRRGKIRVTSVEEADALIAQAATAKVMLLAAKAAIDPADPGVPAHDEAAPAPLPPLCAQPAPDSSPGECARLDGHRPPHRNLAGYEWGEEEGEDYGDSPAEASSDDDVTAAARADASPGHGPGDCVAHGAYPQSASGLFCWRPRGHDGWHYDIPDKLAWRLAGTEAARS